MEYSRYQCVMHSGIPPGSGSRTFRESNGYVTASIQTLSVTGTSLKLRNQTSELKGGSIICKDLMEHHVLHASHAASCSAFTAYILPCSAFTLYILPCITFTLCVLPCIAFILCILTCSICSSCSTMQFVGYHAVYAAHAIPGCACTM